MTIENLAAMTAGVLAEPPAAADPDAGVHALSETHLPGVGEEQLSLRQGLAMGGGVFTFWVLLLLNTLDELGNATLSVLGPDIGDALGVGDGVIVFMAAASAAFVVLGVLPLGWLGDRYRRGPIIGVCSAVFGAMAVASGLVVNAFQLFCTRFVSGIAKANTLPVHGSLLADTYPIGVRGRIGSAIGGAGAVVAVLSPALVGGLATLFGGVDGEGWRWTFVLLGLPVGVLAVLAFFLREPRRGRWERASVLGVDVEGDGSAGAVEEVPVSIEMAFGRLKQIGSIQAMVVALAAIGFQLFPMVTIANFYLRDEYDLDALGRGVVGSVSGSLAIVVIPFVGMRFDRMYRRSPARAMRIIGYLLLPGIVLTPLQFSMPNPVLYTLVAIPGASLVGAAFSILGPLFQNVVPYRLRSVGIAYTFVYLFLIGAVGGSLIGALLSESFSTQTTIIMIAVPTSLVGALVLIRGSRWIDADLANVAAELRDEQEEQERATVADAPVLYVSGVDFAYGSVQVLFDVDLEVAPGESVALLGTNGAGKSTLLNVVSGLNVPSSGIVRLGGRTITFASPEQRAKLGIQMLPGGKGVFRALSIEANLEMGAYLLPRELRAERMDRVWGLFPGLAARRGVSAGSLSGGQQQQLALARVLLHDPQLLIIDELSLGLAPTIVADLIETLERLKQAGQAMLIVEQSINVALTIADRAVFMEKGRVRFSGPAAELLERDDLARAVFLGSAT